MGQGKCSSAVCLSVRLVGACYSLSVRGLYFVAVLSPSFRGENHSDLVLVLFIDIEIFINSR